MKNYKKLITEQREIIKTAKRIKNELERELAKEIADMVKEIFPFWETSLSTFDLRTLNLSQNGRFRTSKNTKYEVFFLDDILTIRFYFDAENKECFNQAIKMIKDAISKEQ